MRFVIPESQGTFMSCKDRPAERKSQPQTAVAVCNLILPGKEHFKDLRFILLRDTGAIIGYIYHDITVFAYAEILIREPFCVYLMALSTRLIMTCMISRASMSARRISSE